MNDIRSTAQVRARRPGQAHAAVAPSEGARRRGPHVRGRRQAAAAGLAGRRHGQVLACVVTKRDGVFKTRGMFLNISAKKISRLTRPSGWLPRRFSPCGKWLTHLSSADGSLTTQLYATDVATGSTKLAFAAGEAGEPLSKEEQMRRERARIMATGVTSYERPARNSKPGSDAAAAATWIVPGDESRRRRGRDVDSPRGRVRRRGRSADMPVETSRGAAAAATRICPRRRVAARPRPRRG